MPDISDQIQRWRERAKEIRAAAEGFAVPSAREIMRRVAANYDKLADDAEARLSSKPPQVESTN
jgi:hypothetical protein